MTPETPAKERRLARCILWSLSLLLTVSPAAAQTFKIATLAPENTQWTTAMRKAADKIREETDGRVKIRFFGGGVMGNDNQVLRKIRIGQLQGAAVSSGPLTQFSRSLELYSLPMVFRNYAEVDHVRQLFDQRLQDGLADAGYISFGFAEGGFAYAMSKQRIANVEQAREQKVWIPSGDESALRAVEAFGISPVPLGLADVLLALQTDTVNSVIGPANAALALQWHTQIRYLVNLPLIYTYGTLVIAKRRFNALRPEDRQIVQKHMSEAFRLIDQTNRQDHEAAFAALKNQGIEFVDPTAEEASRWRLFADRAVRSTLQAELLSEDLYRELVAALDLYRSTEEADTE